MGTSPGHVVVAFRGTESPTSLDGLKDLLLTDALNLLVVPEGRLGHDLAAAGVGARFHKGFTTALADIWDPVRTTVEAALEERDRPLWITGHSLGGALALLSAWLFRRRMVAVHQVHTFGAPMIGNRAACSAFDRELPGRIQRYVNGRDPVPKLPALSLVANEFGHVDAERLLGTEPSLPLASVLGGIAARAAGGLLAGTLIDEAWQGITAEVNSHFLDRYRQLLGGRSHARAPRARPFRTGTPHPPTFAEDANISRLPDRHSERVFSPPPRRKATGSDAAGIPHVISLDALYDADRVADAW